MLADKMDRPTLGCGLKHVSEQNTPYFGRLYKHRLCNRAGGAMFTRNERDSFLEDLLASTSPEYLKSISFNLRLESLCDDG